MMIQYENGMFHMYNLYGNGKEANKELSVDKWFANVKAQNGNDRTPWAIIEVSK